MGLMLGDPMLEVLDSLHNRQFEIRRMHRQANLGIQSAWTANQHDTYD